MVPLSFGLLLFSGVPIALVLAITAMIYIWASGNDVLLVATWAYPSRTVSRIRSLWATLV